MKILISVFLLFVISAVIVHSARCPAKFLNRKCFCFEGTGFMSCSQLDPDWMKNSELDAKFELDVLVITDSPNLPRLDEKFKSPNVLTAKRVVYNLNSDTDIKFPPVNLDALLTIATEVIEIKSAIKVLTLDSPKFPSTIKTLILENVHIIHYEQNIIEDLNFLKTLQLNKVTFTSAVNNPTFKNPLTRIDIINCDSFTGTFQFVPPSKCTEEIVLNIQNNKQLTDFSTENLFENFPTTNCKYVIDLTGSQLKPDFLTKNSKKFKDNIKGIDQLYIVLRDVKSLICDKCIATWYKKREQYVHSVFCENSKPNKNFLDKATSLLDPDCPDVI